MQVNHSNSRLLFNNIEPHFLYPLCGMYVVVIVSAVMGNTFVFFTIVATKSLRRSATNIFILSLSISDLLTASVTMPLEVEILLRDGQWRHGETMCNVWTTLYLIVVPTSILTLLAVSIDRYKTLSDPLNKYRKTRFMTRKRAIVVVTALWLYSVVFALIPQMGWKISPESVSYGRCNFNITYGYSAMSSIINFIVPMLLTCLIYIKIYQIAKKDVHDGDTNRKSSLGRLISQKILMKNLQAAKTISFIFCGVFLCWFPFTVFSLIGDFCLKCASSVSNSLPSVLLLLGYANSALSPYLYSFKNKKFRDSSKQIARRFSRRSSESYTGRRDYPDVINDLHPRRVFRVSVNMLALDLQNLTHKKITSTEMKTWLNN